MNRFVYTPSSISFSTLKNKNWILSPSIYKRLNIPNSNLKTVRDFLSQDLSHEYLGFEVGSINYIQKSTHFFLKTKALQYFSFIPQFTEDSLTPIFPQVFNDMNLKKGDLLISKDSNIGEAVILDEDYPNVCLSGAIYKLPLSSHKYYLFAFLKHQVFREQLDYLVPKGATIRHAKKLFLDCFIPLPKNNSEEVISYVELLTQAIIEKEIAIKKKHSEIIDLIEEEIVNNQLDSHFSFSLPYFSELLNIGRLDCSHYSKEYKEFRHLISNYKFGFYNFSEDGYKFKRGQNLQFSNIGQSIYSDNFQTGFYRLILSKHISDFSSINDFQFIGNANSLTTLKKGEIVLSARGDIGRVYISPYDIHKTITNIDSIVFYKKDSSIEHDIFNAMFLNYLRTKKIIHRFGIIGSGAPSLTKYQIDDIIIPSFPVQKQSEIAQKYHHLKVIQDPITLENFSRIDNDFNSKSGIFEINVSLLQMKTHLQEVLDSICNNNDIDFSFDFYNISGL